MPRGRMSRIRVDIGIPWCHQGSRHLSFCATVLALIYHPQSHLLIQNWLLELLPMDTLQARRRRKNIGNVKEVGRSFPSELSPFKHTILSTPYWLKLNYMITPIAKNVGKCSLLSWVALCLDKN